MHKFSGLDWPIEKRICGAPAPFYSTAIINSHKEDLMQNLHRLATQS
jgi:hypothetical protein